MRDYPAGQSPRLVHLQGVGFTECEAKAVIVLLDNEQLMKALCAVYEAREWLERSQEAGVQVPVCLR